MSEFCIKCGGLVCKSTAGNYNCPQCGYSNLNVTFYGTSKDSIALKQKDKVENLQDKKEYKDAREDIIFRFATSLDKELRKMIVFCDNCRYRNDNYCAFWDTDSTLQEVSKNDFCSKGKRIKERVK